MRTKSSVDDIDAECTEDASKEVVKNGDPISTFQLIDEAGEIRLVPVPSRDPNDPLQLPKWRKFMCLMTVCLYAGIGLGAIQAIAGILPVMATYYMGLDSAQSSNSAVHARAMTASPVPAIPGAPSYQTSSQLGTLPSLFVGVCGILSVLLAQCTGTRFVMVLDSAFGVRLPMGPLEVCIHTLRRAALWVLVLVAWNRWYRLYFATFITFMSETRGLRPCGLPGGSSAQLLVIASTNIVAALSWKWFYWILGIAAAVSFIMVLCFIPETTWPRTDGSIRGTAPVGVDGYADAVRPSNRSYSYLYSLRLISEHGSLKAVMTAAVDLLRCVCLPNAIWVVCLNAVFIGASLSTGLVFGVVLVAPPYDWKESNVGLMGIPLAVAGILSVLISGIGADIIIRWKAKRNNGIHEPEHQLLNMILPILTGFVGSLLFGIACNDPYRYHWIVPMIAFGLQQFGFVSANVVATTYTIECYRGLASALVIVVGALRNIVGFGISYSAVSFVDRNGFLGCFGTYSGLLGAMALLGIPFNIFGKKLRGRMESWKVGSVTV